MIIKVTKDINSYAMAGINYDGKTYVIPWEYIKMKLGTDKPLIRDITWCVNKNTVTFTLILENKSLVVVYNAETGNYEYILEGKDIIKAVYCGDKVVAIAKISNVWSIAVACRYISMTGSFEWECDNLNIAKRSHENDYDDYELVVAGNTAFMKIQTPLNIAEYMKYAENNFSIYGLYEYWRDKDIRVFEGEPQKDSLYLEFSSGEPLSLNKITYCNDPKFAAGYLKYIVLGDAAYMLLLSDSERDKYLQKSSTELENDFIPDVDYLLNTIIRNCSNKNNIVYLFEEMAELCDMVFMAKSRETAVELLTYACNVCNSYFENEIYQKTGFKYLFNMYNGISSAKKAVTSNLQSDTELCEKFEEIADKNTWDEPEKCIIKAIMLFKL